jgi:hypothetical protein
MFFVSVQEFRFWRVPVTYQSCKLYHGGIKRGLKSGNVYYSSLVNLLFPRSITLNYLEM